MCGATQGQNQQAASTTAAYNASVAQAQQLFGESSSAFNDLMDSYRPTIAAGPSQQGYSQGELSNLDSAAITQNGVEAKNVKEAVGNAESSQVGAGGGGPVGPGGATVGANLSIAENAANQTSTQLSQITQAGYEHGTKNYDTAVQGATQATGVFGSANNATEAATGAGNSANTAISNVAQAAQAPWQLAAGALGSVAGAAAGNPALFSGGGSTPTLTNINGGSNGNPSLATQANPNNSGFGDPNFQNPLSSGAMPSF
jgi:hypothetical protein